MLGISLPVLGFASFSNPCRSKIRHHWMIRSEQWAQRQYNEYWLSNGLVPNNYFWTQPPRPFGFVLNLWHHHQSGREMRKWLLWDCRFYKNNENTFTTSSFCSGGGTIFYHRLDSHCCCGPRQTKEETQRCQHRNTMSLNKMSRK